MIYQTVFISIFLSLTFFINGCGSEKQPDSSIYIPKEADAVIAVNVSELMEKANYSKIMDSEIGDEIFREFRQAPRIIRKTIEDPYSLGLDLEKPVLAFMNNPKKPAEVITYHKKPSDAITKIFLILEEFESFEKELNVNDLKRRYGLKINSDVESKWNFYINWDYSSRYNYNTYEYEYYYYPISIDARSKKKMEDGPGYSIFFDIRYGDFEGYGYEIDDDIRPPSNFGIIAWLGEDRSKFESKYNSILDFFPEHVKVVEVKANDGSFKYFYFKENPDENLYASFALGFNNDIAMLLFKPDSHDSGDFTMNWIDDIASIIAGEKKNNIISTKPGFLDIYDFDIAAWNDLSWANDVKEMISNEITRYGDEEIAEYLEDLPFGLNDNYIVAGAKTEIGNINFNLACYTNDEISNIFNKGVLKSEISNSLVDKFPDDPVAGYAAGINIKPIVDFIFEKSNSEVRRFKKDLRREIDLSIDEAASIPQGSMFAALYDADLSFGRYGSISGDIEGVIGIEINDVELFKSASKELTGSDISKDPVDIQHDFSTFLSDNSFFIAHKNYERGLRKNTFTNSIRNKLSKDFNSSNLYAFIDIDRAIDFLPRRNNDSRRIKTIIRELSIEFIGMGLSSNEKSIEAFANIKFNSLDRDPLTVISETILDNMQDW